MPLTRNTLFDRYHLRAAGDWDENSLAAFELACHDFFALAPDRFKPWHWVENVLVQLTPMTKGGLTRKGEVILNPNGLTAWTVVHELAHAWDAANGWRLSARMAHSLGSGFPFLPLFWLFPKDARFWYRVGSPPPPCGIDRYFNRFEDFAETVTAYIYPAEARQKAAQRGFAYQQYGYEQFHDTPRGQWLKNLLEQ